MENKDTQILKISNKGLIGFFIIGMGGIIGGVYLIKSNYYPWHILCGWAVITLSFFGVVSFFLYPPRIIISPEGFEIKAIGTKGITHWSDVQGFEVRQGLAGLIFPIDPLSFKNVVFNYADSYKRSHSRFRLISKAVYGWDGGIVGNYGMTAKDLADFLNKKRAEYLGLKS